MRNMIPFSKLLKEVPATHTVSYKISFNNNNKKKHLTLFNHIKNNRMSVLLAMELSQALTQHENGTIHHAHHVQTKYMLTKAQSNVRYMAVYPFQPIGNPVLHSIQCMLTFKKYPVI